MTPAQRERQLVSWAFGNAGIEDPTLTREAIEGALRTMKEREAEG